MHITNNKCLSTLLLKERIRRRTTNSNVRRREAEEASSLRRGHRRLRTTTHLSTTTDTSTPTTTQNSIRLWCRPERKQSPDPFVKLVGSELESGENENDCSFCAFSLFSDEVAKCPDHQKYWCFTKPCRNSSLLLWIYQVAESQGNTNTDNLCRLHAEIFALLRKKDNYKVSSDKKGPVFCMGPIMLMPEKNSEATSVRDLAAVLQRKYPEFSTKGMDDKTKALLPHINAEKKLPL